MLLGYDKKIKHSIRWDDQTNAALEQKTTAICECHTLMITLQFIFIRMPLTSA